MFLWSLTGAVLKIPQKSFRRKRNVFTDSPTKKDEKFFSKELFCFKYCSEPCFRQIRTSHKKNVAMRLKVFASTFEVKKKELEKTFLQRVSLVTSRAVSITSLRFFSTHGQNCFAQLIRKKWKNYKFFLLIFFFSKISHSTLRRQFFQPCWNDFSKRLKECCPLCVNGQKSSSKKRFLPENVPLAMKNYFLETAPKKFTRKPETIQSVSKNEEEVKVFQIKVFSLKCFTENVKFSYGMLAKMFDQNSITFCSRNEKVRNSFHSEFILTHGFFCLSNVQFSKIGRKVFAMEFLADCQKMKKRVFFKKNCLKSSFGHVECKIEEIAYGFLPKNRNFSVEWLIQNDWKNYRSQKKTYPQIVPLDMKDQYWNRVN